MSFFPEISRQVGDLNKFKGLEIDITKKLKKKFYLEQI
jgi:hypothetical protein